MKKIFLTLLITIVLPAAPLLAEIPKQHLTVAQPVSETSLKNFYQVSPDVYRSGQPKPTQMAELEKRGFKSILNLRSLNSDNDEASATNLQLFHIKMSAGSFNDQQMIEALKIIHYAPKPLLVHCWHGSDRTGAVIAMYRIVLQDWPKQAAIDELMQPQFGHHKTIYANIPRYIANADIEMLRAKVLDSDHSAATKPID